MVREVLQNSLDNPGPEDENVEVTFKTIEIDPRDINANQLKEHVGAALQQVTKDQDSESTKKYQKMMEILSQPSITCLAILDAGTTGLQGDKWTNLIFREGTPTHNSGESRGGSFGFGKNAPFNFSDCNTVLYSTKYINRAKKGVMKYMAGRSQLVSHDNPEKSGERLQQAGFLANHERNNPNQPVEGPEIPEPFRLKNIGTGVFIIGFDKSRRNWIREIAETTVTHFFYAIHTGKLSVTISKGSQKDDGQEINRTTLQAQIEQLPEKAPTRHYHAALTQDKPTLTDPSGLLNKDGVPQRVQLWISTDPSGPHRVAHINRRGMLITEARQFYTNPFYPDGGTAWNGWAAVTMAENDQTDQFLRRMEPPAHDAIQFKQIRDENERESAEQELRHHRKQIARTIRDRINEYLTNDSENITELADLFPDDPGINRNLRQIKPRVIQHHEESDVRSQLEDEEPTDPQQSPENSKGEDREREDKEREDSDPSEMTPVTPQPQVYVQNARIIRTAPDELTMSLVMPDTKDGSMEFEIRTAGEQYQRNEECVEIGEIRPNENMFVTAQLDGAKIRLAGAPRASNNHQD